MDTQELPHGSRGIGGSPEVAANRNAGRHVIARRTTIFAGTAAAREVVEHVHTVVPDNQEVRYMGSTGLSPDEVLAMRWKALGYRGKPMTDRERAQHAERRAVERGEDAMHGKAGPRARNPEDLTPEERLAEQLKLCATERERQDLVAAYARRHGAAAAAEVDAAALPETGPILFAHFPPLISDLLETARLEKIPADEVKDAKDRLIRRLTPAKPETQDLVDAVLCGLQAKKFLSAGERELALAVMFPVLEGAAPADAAK